MPIGTNYGKAVVINQRVFVCREQIVQIYDVKTNKWSTLPPSPYSRRGATIIKDQLTLIGGWDTHYTPTLHYTPTSKLATWTGEEWLELYPPMHNARSDPGVLAIGDLVIVSGGKGAGKGNHPADGREVNTIEFLDVKNRKWIQSNLKLPQPLSDHHMALCGEYIYIYYNWYGYFWRMNKKNLMASLTNNDVHHWKQLENAPRGSSLLQNSTLPVLVGPKGIFIFEKKWTQISKETSYYNTCTASLNGTTFLTIGGLGGQDKTRAVQYDIVVKVSNLFNYKTLHLSIKILVNISCALRVHFLLQIETLEGFISFVRVI